MDNFTLAPTNFHLAAFLCEGYLINHFVKCHTIGSFLVTETLADWLQCPKTATKFEHFSTVICHKISHEQVLLVAWLAIVASSQKFHRK